MDIPGSWEEIRLVGILRAIRKTHQEISENLKIQKLRVGNIEKWLRGAPYYDVEALFTDDGMQKRLKNAIDNKEIDAQDLLGAARLTTEDILEHFRTDYYQYRKKSIKTFGEAESTLHQEHHKSMLKLVERLIIDLKPDLSAPNIREFKDLKKGKGDVHVDYVLKPNENIEIQLVREYLEQHFNSSAYGWVMNDKENGMIKWTRIVNDELNRRIKLLRSIDREATRPGFTMSNPNSIGHIGLLYWFCESIFDSVLENLYLDLDYRVESAENRLFGLRYGPAFIAQTERKEKVLEYKDYHKQLMARYEKSKMVKAIKRIKKERNTTAEEIIEVLYKFQVDKHVPGKCDYEFCG